MGAPIRKGHAGFSLVELAVVLTIVALLLTSLILTLGAQTEQRNFEETRRRLEQARELILSFALVNGRLPCPARSTSTGFEVRDAGTGQCTDGTNQDYYGGTVGAATGGLLPAATIGFPGLDSGGFAVDAWGNRIRYAVSRTVDTATCAVTPTQPHWVNAANMRANGIACQPNDLLICKSSTGITASACGGAANQIMATGLVVAIVFSTGKNGATGGTGNDEAANLNGGGTTNPIFVWHTPTPSSASNGEFDDQFTWITAGELYGKLVAGGVLP